MVGERTGAVNQHYQDWIATYRAALTGLYAYGKYTHQEDINRLATRAADLQHGPLPADESPKLPPVKVP
jgi:hypothetical protein